MIKVNLCSTITKIQKTLKQLQPGVVALVRQKQADLYEINVNLVNRAGPRPARLQIKNRSQKEINCKVIASKYHLHSSLKAAGKKKLGHVHLLLSDPGLDTQRYITDQCRPEPEPSSSL